MDLALNNLQWLICHKIQPKQYLSNPSNLYSYMVFEYFKRFSDMLITKSAGAVEYTDCNSAKE